MVTNQLYRSLTVEAGLSSRDALGITGKRAGPSICAGLPATFFRHALLCRHTANSPLETVVNHRFVTSLLSGYFATSLRGGSLPGFTSSATLSTAALAAAGGHLLGPNSVMKKTGYPTLVMPQ